MKWGGKQKWRRERERESKKGGGLNSGWLNCARQSKAMVEVNTTFGLCCNCSRWEVARRPQRSQCEDWGSRERRCFSSVAQQSDFSLFLLRFLHSKNAMETWSLSCWIPKQTFLFFFFFKTYNKMECRFKTKDGIRDLKMGLSDYNVNRISLFRDTGFRNSHYLDKHGVLKPAYLI